MSKIPLAGESFRPEEELKARFRRNLIISLVALTLLGGLIALIEYFFMIPANNIGSRINGGPYSLMQLKIIQEAISITVFTTMAITMFRTETLQWNHVVAFVLIIGAVFFAFLK